MIIVMVVGIYMCPYHTLSCLLGSIKYMSVIEPWLHDLCMDILKINSSPFISLQIMVVSDFLDFRGFYRNNQPLTYNFMGKKSQVDG